MLKTRILLLAGLALCAGVPSAHAQQPANHRPAQEANPWLKRFTRSTTPGVSKPTMPGSRALRPPLAPGAVVTRDVPPKGAPPLLHTRPLTALAVTGEIEPNDTTVSANRISLGDQGTGVIDPQGDADFWIFTVQAGDLLDIDVDAWEFGSPLDATLELLAPDGQTFLAYNDDFDGLDSRIQYRVESGGDYYIVIRGLGGGGSQYTYTINFQTMVCPDDAEGEPNDTPGTAFASALGEQVEGHICPPYDADYFVFTATAGTILDIDVEAEVQGSQLDSYLELYGADGLDLLAWDYGYDFPDARIVYRVLQDGEYYVVIRDQMGRGGSDYHYTLNFGTTTCPNEVAEGEPNDTPAWAHGVILGEQVDATICPSNDADFYAFTATAGTVVELDVDASTLGSPLDATLQLYADGGTTFLAYNDDWDGLDSRIQYTLPAYGEYHVVIRDLGDRGGPDYFYTLKFGVIEPGPGDPVTTLAANIEVPIGLAAGPNGDLFVGDLFADRIVRITPNGSASTFASIPAPLGLAFDAFGDLLVASSDGDVYKVTSNGQVTTFLNDPLSPFWIAVAPDGGIWISDPYQGMLRSYDMTGRFVASFDVSDAGGFGPGPMAFAPDGALHFSVGSAIYKLTGGQPQLVLESEPTLWGFAFDVNGNLYVANPERGRMILYGPDGTLLEDPFAIQLTAPFVAAFGRNADGSTNARLFVSDTEASAVLELNPSGVRAAGWPLGFTASFSIDDAVTRLLNDTAMPESEMRYLDTLGNRNGRYDLGDFRALLIHMGIMRGALAASGVGM